MNMMRQRCYYDGKLQKPGRPVDAATARKYLDNIERDWSRNLQPLTLLGQFDPNNGHQVTRISLDELSIVTTGGHTLRFVNVAIKGTK